MFYVKMPNVNEKVTQTNIFFLHKPHVATFILFLGNKTHFSLKKQINSNTKLFL